jgi:inorganic triphosphatase YgiF
MPETQSVGRRAGADLSGHDQPVEVELKFVVDDGVQDQLLEHPSLQGRESVSTLQSVYFDTPERALRRACLGLRVRDTGRGFFQTVKRDQPGGGSVRREWEAEVEDNGVDADVLARTPAADVLDGETCDLEPVFATRIERRARILRLGKGVIEASFDRGEVSSGRRRAPICELELELKKGDPEVLYALARELAGEAPLCLSFESKAEQGYRLADDTTLDPRPAGELQLAPDAPAIEAFQRIALAALAQACANAALLRRLARPEAVHQTRVGLRRFRAALAAFKPLACDQQRPHIDGEVKWLAGELDAARDLDVFIEGVFRPAAAEVDEEGLAGLGRCLLRAQTDAYERALAAVRSQRCGLLLVETAAWIETGAWSRPEDPVLAQFGATPIREFAAGSLDHLRRVVRRRGKGFRRLDPVSRHKLRIRAKRLRYAAEFFGGLFDDRAKAKDRFVEALKQLQDCLGALNDIVVARQRPLQLAELEDPAMAFAAGRIVGRREDDEADLLEAAADALRGFRKAPRFWRDDD